MKTIVLSILCVAGFAQAQEEKPWLKSYSGNQCAPIVDYATQSQLDYLNQQLQLQRAMERRVEVERHADAERDFTFRVIFGK